MSAYGVRLKTEERFDVVGSVPDALSFWGTRDFLALIPGSRPKTWRAWIRELVAARILVKRGKGWLGRRSQIEAGLLKGVA